MDTKPKNRIEAMPRGGPDNMGRILAIDIGGSGVKAAIVDRDGNLQSNLVRTVTPRDSGPDAIVGLLVELVKPLGGFDRVAIAFPGYVRAGKVFTAPNLGTELWAGFDLAEAIHTRVGRPTLLANDADMQGLAAIGGRGRELVCTLGTGLGSAWFHDGVLLPHMELAHMAVHRSDDLDNYIGDSRRRKIGNKKWSRRVEKLIGILAVVFNYDRLYLGGGNARHIKFKLPRNVSVIPNEDGIKGGAFLWRQIADGKKSPPR